MRRVALAVIASGVFGGVVGALATAATQSAASPRAIAAAVQHVQDASAERSLRSIDSDLSHLNSAVTTQLGYIDEDINHNADVATNNVDDLYLELYKICENTSGTGGICPYNYPMYSPGPHRR